MHNTARAGGVAIVLHDVIGIVSVLALRQLFPSNFENNVSGKLARKVVRNSEQASDACMRVIISRWSIFLTCACAAPTNYHAHAHTQKNTAVACNFRVE